MRASVGCCDWLTGCAVIFVAVRGVWIGYIRCTLWGGSSTDAAPVTGSLVCFTPLNCLNDSCAAECASGWLFCGTTCVWEVGLYWTTTMDGGALVEDRAGITSGVELFVPWNAVVDIESEGVVPLGSVPDVVGIVGRRPDATGSRILRGRDVRSIRVLVPDVRGLDRCFHDVTIVDMSDEPEVSVSLPELSALREQWPPAVLHHMVWLQQDLELMRADAKKRVWQTKPTPCVYCGRVTKCDMYQHVTKFYLDLHVFVCRGARCHGVRGGRAIHRIVWIILGGAHNVPWIGKMANLEQFVPPWTVHRQVWSDLLKAAHSGISTDILLFSDLHLSLTHHYRVNRRGLPHIAFRKDYMLKLRALLPVPVVLPSVMVSPSVELKDESPRRTRRAQRRIRLVRVMDGLGCALPVLSLQDPADAQGEVVYDCWPPLLPVSLQLGELGTLARLRPAASASVAVPPWEVGPSVSESVSFSEARCFSNY